MAIANESVTVAVCDACGRRTYGEPGEQPRVITGLARDYTGDREKVGEWSACGPKHVGPAVATVLKKATPTRVSSIPTPAAPSASVGESTKGVNGLSGARPAGTPQTNVG